MGISGGDIFFTAGEIPKRAEMYFLLRGAMVYVGPDGFEFDVAKKTWFCEACLWTSWVHMGDMVAVSDSSILCLDAEAFHHIATSFPALLEMARTYATSYITELNSNRTVSDVAELAERQRITAPKQ